MKNILPDFATIIFLGFLFIVIPGGVLHIAMNSNVELLLWGGWVIFIVGVLLFVVLATGVALDQKKQREIAHFNKNAFSVGYGVPYGEYVDFDGNLKNTDKWTILYDGSISDYCHEDNILSHRMMSIRLVATDIGKLALIYFTPNHRTQFNNWERGYIIPDGHVESLRLVLKYFGKEGYQVAKGWLAANSTIESGG